MYKLMQAAKQATQAFAREEDGAQVVEYALIIAVVSIALVIALRSLTTGTTFSSFHHSGTELPDHGHLRLIVQPDRAGRKAGPFTDHARHHANPHSSPARARQRQQGSVVVLAAMLLLLLLGFAGIALDFGRLFIVKTELQTAMDSCALAAAQELDSQSSALTRARNAGLTAANLNRVNLQSASWDGKGQAVAADISFKDAAWADTAAAASARYAVVQPQPDRRAHVAAAPAGRRLRRQRSPIRPPATCWPAPSPPAPARKPPARCRWRSRPRSGGTAPNYGFQVGEWVNVFDKGGASAGEMGWYNLDGSKSASETSRRTERGRPLRHPGGRHARHAGRPDQRRQAVEFPLRHLQERRDPGRQPPRPERLCIHLRQLEERHAAKRLCRHASARLRSHRRQLHHKRAATVNFDNGGTSLKAGSQIAFGDQNKLNSFKNIATNAEHASYGYNRRVVVVPVIDAASKVIDYVCMFMLAPMTGPNDTVQMEFRSNAANPSTPCTTNGLPGGSAGPLVPVLVR